MKMTFNKDKSRVLHIHKTKSEEDVEIYLGDSRLTTVKAMSYLGMIFHYKMNWKP